MLGNCKYNSTCPSFMCDKFLVVIRYLKVAREKDSGSTRCEYCILVISLLNAIVKIIDY